MGVLVSGGLASGGSPVISKVDSRYVLFEQGPFGTNRRDSVRKASGVCLLSDILLTGGQ